MQLLKYKEKGTTRLVMRKDTTVEVIAKHSVFPDMKLHLELGVIKFGLATGRRR